MPRCARPYTDIDERILALYFRGMSVADIEVFVGPAYAGQVTPDVIGRVLDAHTEEIAAWQARELEPMYPVVFFDALPVQIKVAGTLCQHSIHWALATLPDGRRDMIGLWSEPAGAHLRFRMLSDLKARGCHDILVAATERLEGITEALTAMFPATATETAGLIELPTALRQVVYSDALESVRTELRRIINMKARGYFPSHEAAMKLIWLAALHAASRWKQGDVRWMTARDQFARLFGERFTHPVLRQ